jgi:hypothetical protein
MLYTAQAKMRIVKIVSGRIATRYVGDRIVQQIVDIYIVPLTWEERLFGIPSEKLPMAIKPERRNWEVMSNQCGLTLKNLPHRCGELDNTTPVFLLRK